MAKRILPPAPNVLKKFSVFAFFSTKRLEEIAKRLPIVSLKANKVAYRQGERSGKMYLILEGGVKVEREAEDGATIHVGELAEYQVFGELALLSKEARHVTVTAVKDSKFLTIDRKMLLDIIRQSAPDEIVKIFYALNDRLRATHDREFTETLLRRTLASQMEAEKQRAITQMVASMAHEINTPLGVINTAVNIMARELAQPEEVTAQRAADIAESLELMHLNVERTERLVHDFKKVAVSQLTYERDFFDIFEVIEETIELIMVSLKRSQVQVKLQNTLTLEQRKWMGYRGLLSQILINLLTNAERYAYPNGVGGIVDVAIRLNDDERYCLTVRDYGKGISKKNQALVFDPFFTTGKFIGGTGLGLAIVHNLVTSALKGEIKLSSVEGKGAEFIVVFPREIPA